MKIMEKLPKAPKVLSVRVEQRLLYKTECMKQAQNILKERKIEHMTAEQIAAELYFHAVVFYFCKAVSGLRIHLFQKLMRHAEQIDLSDYGDTPVRQYCFRLLWLLPGKNKTGSDIT